MKTHLDCIPCFVRQTLETIKLASDDPILHKKAMREMMGMLSEMDFENEPVIMGREIQRLIQRLSGNPDPYKALKHQYNQMALDLYPRLKEQVNAAESGFEVAARLALAGNMIDFGTGRMLDPSDVSTTIELALSANLKGDIQSLYEAVAASHSILYVGDNCGEIVFDRLFIDQLIPDRVTYAVRSAPIINDVTLEDAIFTGMTDRVRVIDSGSDAPGTLLAECSQTFKKTFNTADLIIAKGQGNYETLHAIDRQIAFMLKVKCPAVAQHIGHEIGSYVIKLRSVGAMPIGPYEGAP
ncbi:MAG: ARMT1-like domain-containing protein [Desulfobacterales bacterium]|jgi:hypothetical protein